MTDLLGFRLAGAMTSWGDVTVGDIRSSWPGPSASALMGLIGAALGIRRDDKTGQDELSALRFAVRLDCPGAPLNDYHTVQTAPIDRKRLYNTRKEALDHADRQLKVQTKLTSRHYYSHQVSTILCWGGDLRAIKNSLNQPAFPLQLGRKACPPSRPLDPHLLEAKDLHEGFSIYDQLYQLDGSPPEKASMTWDLDGPIPGIEDFTRHIRRDRPRDRGAEWSFATRTIGEGMWESIHATDS